MGTILFLGKSYVGSVDELRQIITSIKSPDNPYYEEVLTLFLDGVLERWLKEGETDEEKLARAVGNIRSDRTYSEIMSELVGVFSNGNVVASYRPDPTKFLKIKKVSYLIGKQLFSIDFNAATKKTIRVQDMSQVRLQIEFEVVKTDKEKLESEFLIGEAKVPFSVKLSNYSVGSEVVFNYVVPQSVKGDCDVRWCFDGKELFSLDLVIVRDKETYTVNGVSFTMVAVEGGTFRMGATAEQGSGAAYDEKPEHKVTLDDYWIGETPVTEGLWTAVMGSNPSYRKKGGDYPVENVSWDDCIDFIAKLNEELRRQGHDVTFRLPTEAEWEFAARGGKKSGRQYKYSGLDNIDEVAWYGGAKHPVKLKAANDLGLFDMSGNVWEWCQDYYGSDYYSHSPSKNPKGPAGTSGSARVSRGGSWDFLAGYCRVSNRGHCTPSSRYLILGLRLAR